MKSLVLNTGLIELPLIVGEFPMIPFDIKTLEGLNDEFKKIAERMLWGIIRNSGIAFFTIHGKKLKKGQTLRRGGPHIDGNYEPHLMTFGGGGWKVGQDGPAINTSLHDRQYNNEKGGIVLASNYEACLGWIGEYDGFPKTGGDCSHMQLDRPFLLERNKVYYGNNHFIHESLEVKDDVHRVFARITMPEDHEFNPPCKIERQMIMETQPHDSVKWGVHILGPDSMLAANDFEEAVIQSSLINRFIINTSTGKTDMHPIVFANVIIWPDNYVHDPDSSDWNEFC